MKNRQISFLILSLFVALIIGVKNWHFFADPDTSITWSKTAFLTDELYHNGNGLKKVVTGSWWLSDYNYLLMDPFMPLMLSGVFKFWGVSLLTLRIPVMVMQILFLLLFVYFTYRRFRNTWPLVAALLALSVPGLDYFWLNYGKLALLDLPMAYWGALALIFYVTFQSPYRWLCCVFLFLALLTKATALVFWLTLMIYVVTQRFIRHITTTTLLKESFLLVLVLLFYGLTLWWLHQRLPAGFLATRAHSLISNKLPTGIMEVVKLMVSSLFNNYLIFNSPLILFTFVIIFFKRKRSVWYKTDTLFLLLFVVVILFHGLFSYHPPRYYLILTIPIGYFMAAVFEAFPMTSHKKWALIAIVILVNSLNIARVFHYHTRPSYSYYHALENIAQNIENQGLTTREVFLLDQEVHTSLPFFLGCDFDYSPAHMPSQKPLIQITSRPLGVGQVIGKYTVYDEVTFWVYRLK